LSDTTGKTTLMLDLVTPRDEVLAVSTGLALPRLGTVACVVPTALPGDEAGRDPVA
jgi:hypothetical protein